MKRLICYSYFMNDIIFMKRALSLARRAKGKTSPNPMVGAVLVKNSQKIAEAYHKKAGTPHAEALVLAEAGQRASGGTLYVTLEPCCHINKRTPPCTKAIISAGVARVVIAMKDPNPHVSGKGVQALMDASIKVECGLLEREAWELNRAYSKHISTGIPYVTLKSAMTLDGKIATPEGQSKWITGPESRKLVHRLRSESDAIMSAIGTVKADNPELTARIRGGRNPVRVIIDPDLETPEGARILMTPPETIIVTRTGGARADKLQSMGIKLLRYEGQLDMKWLMRELGSMGIVSVLAEGGASFNWHCLDGGIVDRAIFFIAPKIIGGRESFPCIGGKTFRRLEDSIMLRGMKVRHVGDDLMIEAEVLRPSD